MDFPTLWNEVLKPDPLVIGPPVQTVRDGRIRMEVRLITGALRSRSTPTQVRSCRIEGSTTSTPPPPLGTIQVK